MGKAAKDAPTPYCLVICPMSENPVQVCFKDATAFKRAWKLMQMFTNIVEQLASYENKPQTGSGEEEEDQLNSDDEKTLKEEVKKDKKRREGVTMAVGKWRVIATVLRVKDIRKVTREEGYKGITQSGDLEYAEGLNPYVEMSCFGLHRRTSVKKAVPPSGCVFDEVLFFDSGKRELGEEDILKAKLQIQLRHSRGLSLRFGDASRGKDGTSVFVPTTLGVFDFHLADVYYAPGHEYRSQWVALAHEAKGQHIGFAQVSVAVLGPGDKQSSMIDLSQDFEDEDALAMGKGGANANDEDNSFERAFENGHIMMPSFINHTLRFLEFCIYEGHGLPVPISGRKALYVELEWGGFKVKTSVTPKRLKKRRESKSDIQNKGKKAGELIERDAYTGAHTMASYGSYYWNEALFIPLEDPSFSDRIRLSLWRPAKVGKSPKDCLGSAVLSLEEIKANADRLTSEPFEVKLYGPAPVEGTEKLNGGHDRCVIRQVRRAMHRGIAAVAQSGKNAVRRRRLMKQTMLSNPNVASNFRGSISIAVHIYKQHPLRRLQLELNAQAIALQKAKKKGRQSLQKAKEEGRGAMSRLKKYMKYILPNDATKSKKKASELYPEDPHKLVLNHTAGLVESGAGEEFIAKVQVMALDGVHAASATNSRYFIEVEIENQSAATRALTVKRNGFIEFVPIQWVVTASIISSPKPLRDTCSLLPCVIPVLAPHPCSSNATTRTRPHTASERPSRWDHF